MCGIAGFTHRRSRPSPDLIFSSTLSLKHRGPDRQGVWESDTVSLGAVRLKIQDLQGGDQPFLSEDGRAVIVFNGEVYNHLEVRAELETLGRRFRTHCDTETVLHAFLEWDTASFGKLRGMFALGIWIEAERRLVLARDRMGIKPLYIARRGDDIYFGSELKALFAHPEIPRLLDRAALSYYLSLNFVPGSYTLIEGVSKLGPGTLMEWRDGDVRTEPYWTLKPWPTGRRSIGSAKEELDALLDSATKEHLLSDVPLGVWASGGVDSSTLVHYASRHFPGKLKTFSVSFAGRKFDESPYFREVARRYGAEHHEFDLNESVGVAATAERLADFADNPNADAGSIPVYFLSAMSRREVTVVLSGEGADELFGGYVTYLADEYAERAKMVPAWTRRLALRLAALAPASNDKIGLDYKVRRFLEGSMLDPESAHFYWNGAFARSAPGIPRSPDRRVRQFPALGFQDPQRNAQVHSPGDHAG
jgi:asparagine synthase (glutamine-hydrolysing)